MVSERRYIILFISVLFVITTALVFMSYKIYVINSLISRVELETGRLSLKLLRLKGASEVDSFDVFFGESASLDKFVRDLIAKYNGQINSYNHNIRNDEYAELTIRFEMNAGGLVNFIYEIEEVRKTIVIDSLSLNKTLNGKLDVSIVIRGYYK